MNNLWVTFSTDISGTFSELSGNIIYNLNNLYNFNGNLVDKTSNFIIYELNNNPIQGGVQLQTSNWNQINLNTNLSPFQGYWLGGINTNLPLIFTNISELQRAVNNWTNNPIPVVNIYGLMENWNVGNVDMTNVTNMSNMFDGATSFNQDLNNWNVGNVTSMSNMFSGATSFNGNISNWNVGNVTSMSNMFADATNFNGNISNWNVGNVTIMSNMFADATNFNGNISNWNVGNVTNMSNMFKNVTFFTNMTGKIDEHGTPYNYFISQRNAIISVNIKAYYISESVLWIYASNLSGGFNAIVNALTISGMDKLVDYSFTSSVDSTSRDILEMTANNESLAYYRVSGYNPNYIIHNNPGQEYTLYFTRRTRL